MRKANKNFTASDLKELIQEIKPHDRTTTVSYDQYWVFIYLSELLKSNKEVYTKKEIINEVFKKHSRAFINELKSYTIFFCALEDLPLYIGLNEFFDKILYWRVRIGK